MFRLRIRPAAIFLSFLLMAPAFGQIPRTLSYQGVLTDATGTPKPDGVYDFTIRLYTVASGGSALWSETKSLQIKRGLFSTILGSVTPLPASLKFDQQYWLSVQVAPDPELSPRIQLTSVGSSLNALRADLAQTVPDSSLTQGKMASGQVVKSINTLKDDVTLTGGSNVTITRSGDTLKIAASGGTGGTDFWAANGNDISNANTGNVGIGTPPLAAYKLDVKGAARVTPGGSGGEILLHSPNAETGMTIIGTNRADLRFDGSTLKLLASPGTLPPPIENGIAITTSGKVGIGTAIPTAKLDVTNHFIGDTSRYGVAVRGYTDHFLGTGVIADAPNGYGVFASSNLFGGYGVQGLSTNLYGRGVQGLSSNLYGTGVLGSSSVSGVGYGVEGSADPSGIAVKADGNMAASGTKAFRIDHPKDPTGKYLLHYSAESPDVLNMYTGNVVTDATGFATITLPDYFEEINKDPRYTLTVINEGGTDFVQAMVVQKIQNNRFVIRSSKPVIEVSWRVDAVRNDLWVRAYGASVQVEKQGIERGKYQHPELYGMPKEMGMNYRPEKRVAAEPGPVRNAPPESKAKN